MLTKTRLALLALSLALLAGAAQAADLSGSLKSGTPDLKSIGPLAFGPEGILFIGDPQGAAIFAIDTGDRKSAGAGAIKVDNIDAAVAALLGTSPKQILINDMAVNPASGNAYLSVSRGRGPDAAPVLLRVGTDGKLQEVALKDVKHSRAELPSPSTKARPLSITDLAYVDGQVIVAGMSSEEFASTLRALPFPFTEAGKPTSVEIYHGAHGGFETRSPVQTFAIFEIKGQPHLLAAYTCTPLVKFPISQLKPGQKIKGTTIAELGNRNKPLDMIVYQKDGKDYLLLANSSRGVMKISTENIDGIDGITQPVKGGGKAGLPYETISSLKGVEQLDKLDKAHALVLIKTPDGQLNLDTIALP